MNVVNLDKYLDTLDVSARARVESSLRRTAEGAMEDLVSPMVPDGDPDYWREKFRDFLLDRMRLKSYPWLRRAEEEQAKKVGAYSYMLPYEDRKESVYAYYSLFPGSPDLDLLEQAKLEVLKFMPVDLNPATLIDAFNQLPRGTNLGAPFFTSDEEYRGDVFKLAEQVEAEGFELDDLFPAMLYWRGQPRGIGEISKNRVVWGTSKVVVSHGSRLQIALLHYLRRTVQFAAWNESHIVDRAMTLAFGISRKQIISADFGSWDARMQQDLIKSTWDVIRLCFRSRHERLIDFEEHQFMNVPLLTPEGMLTGQHAVASGEAETNLVDGIGQMILWHYVALKLGAEVKFICVQGDDGVIIMDPPIDIDEASQIIQTDFGMALSAEKGLIAADEIRFLQNVHFRYYERDGINVHVRPIERVLNGMLSYETMRKKSIGWNGFMDSLRWYQQCEQAKYHPNFDVLVEFLYSRDKYSRQFTIGEIIDQAGGIEKTAKAFRQKSFPYGKEPLSKLSQFRIVQDLSAMRRGLREVGEAQE